MRKPGISQKAELVVQRLFVWISRLLPIRPVGQLEAKHLSVGSPARGVHTSAGNSRHANQLGDLDAING